jgi:hypothetical protein
MKRSIYRAAALVGISVALGACTGGNKTKDNFQAAADSMGTHLDSTKRALDTAKTGAAVGQQVDTTKLGAAKTESILTKARKTP